MFGLSKKEMEIIRWLEAERRQFLTSADLERFCNSRIQRYNLTKSLVRKHLLVKLNRRKYYYMSFTSSLPNQYALIDEICDGVGYVIGGLSAAHYWRLTGQSPQTIDVYTTRRQGTVFICGIRIRFHRTSAKRLQKAVRQTFDNRGFFILSNKETSKWVRKNI
jgi:predicted transcriptional regulator of viral defense system